MRWTGRARSPFCCCLPPPCRRPRRPSASRSASVAAQCLPVDRRGDLPGVATVHVPTTRCGSTRTRMAPDVRVHLAATPDEADFVLVDDGAAPAAVPGPRQDRPDERDRADARPHRRPCDRGRRRLPHLCPFGARSPRKPPRRCSRSRAGQATRCRGPLKQRLFAVRISARSTLPAPNPRQFSANEGNRKIPRPRSAPEPETGRRRTCGLHRARETCARGPFSAIARPRSRRAPRSSSWRSI